MEKGVAANKPGVRVAMCAVLSDVHAEEGTDALLELLENDHAVWVRIQALRSLCAPGRDIKKEMILEASKNERNPRVLQLRADLLGE